MLKVCFLINLITMKIQLNKSCKRATCSGILGQINLETLNNVHAIAPNILKAKKT